MNNNDILEKTKDVINDYLLLCQTQRISVADYIAFRKEAVYELQTDSMCETEKRVSSSSPLCSVQYESPQASTPGVTAAVSSVAQTDIIQADSRFDPFNENSSVPVDRKESDAVNSGITRSMEKKSTNNKQNQTENKNSQDDDPFFRMIKKIND